MSRLRTQLRGSSSSFLLNLLTSGLSKLVDRKALVKFEADSYREESQRAAGPNRARKAVFALNPLAHKTCWQEGIGSYGVSTLGNGRGKGIHDAGPVPVLVCSLGVVLKTALRPVVA